MGWKKKEERGGERDLTLADQVELRGFTGSA